MLALTMRERVMLRRFIFVMAIVAAFGMMSGPTGASAAGHGARGGHAHSLGSPSFSRHTFRHNRGVSRAAPYRGYSYWPYGGFGGEYLPNNYIDPIGAFVMLQRLDPMIPPPPALTCHHSEETKTVPSESGGTVQITITRC
jgi:hypothetical protein